jgi:hypothetical protein
MVCVPHIVVQSCYQRNRCIVEFNFNILGIVEFNSNILMFKVISPCAAVVYWKVVKRDVVYKIFSQTRP